MVWIKTIVQLEILKYQHEDMNLGQTIVMTNLHKTETTWCKQKKVYFDVLILFANNNGQHTRQQ